MRCHLNQWPLFDTGSGTLWMYSLTSHRSDFFDSWAAIGDTQHQKSVQILIDNAATSWLSRLETPRLENPCPLLLMLARCLAGVLVALRFWSHHFAQSESRDDMMGTARRHTAGDQARRQTTVLCGGVQGTESRPA
jgi:hypothetical protein